jgi:hypothetical protein
MTQVQHQLDSPTYVISDDKEIREGQEAWSRLKKHMLNPNMVTHGLRLARA